MSKKRKSVDDNGGSEEPVKRKPGRPPGSKNKKTIEKEAATGASGPAKQPAKTRKSATSSAKPASSVPSSSKPAPKPPKRARKASTPAFVPSPLTSLSSTTSTPSPDAPSVKTETADQAGTDFLGWGEEEE
ncbi:hypothetical protein V5O48_017267, partial [Marasmius crinis-equi]